MASLRTHITEIVTGLGITDIDAIAHVLTSRRLPAIRNVTDSVWSGIVRAYGNGEYTREFRQALDNGRHFFQAREGLDGKAPYLIEWKGDHRSIGDETVPTDLRVNRVYLVSCKYKSKILQNPSPSRLFDHLLGDRGVPSGNWYATVAENEFQAFYDKVRCHLPEGPEYLPPCVQDLDSQDKRFIKGHISGRLWPSALRDDYQDFCATVSRETAMRWRKNINSSGKKNRLVHRLIRLCPCPYFILGAKGSQPVRLRVDSPWDWAQRFTLQDFEVFPARAGQPQVNWHFTCKDNRSGQQHTIGGHIEIRWSHGRFSGNPEAKVYLDSELHEVPGYNLFE